MYCIMHEWRRTSSRSEGADKSSGGNSTFASKLFARTLSWFKKTRSAIFDSSSSNVGKALSGIINL